MERRRKGEEEEWGEEGRMNVSAASALCCKL